MSDEDPKETQYTWDTVFFGDVIPRALLDARRQAIETNDGTKLGQGTWFLVTGRPHGSEWIDDMLYHYGLFIVDVEDVEAVRQELLQIKVSK